MTQNGPDCLVSSRSRSQTFSYYDYCTNYCNLWNVIKHGGVTSDLKTENCLWVPADSEVKDTCAKYWKKREERI